MPSKPASNPKRKAEPPGSATRPPLVFRKSAKKAKLDPAPSQGSDSKPNTNASSADKGKARQVTDQRQMANGKPLKSAMKKTGGGQNASLKQVHNQAATPRPSTQRTSRDVGIGPSIANSKSKTSTVKPKASRTVVSSLSPGIAATTTTWILPPPALPSFRIIVGSYERLLYGIQVTHSNGSPSSSSSSESLSLSLTPIFQFPAHPSSIKALATAGASSKFLVTAGQDELIKIWDLRRRREVGSLSGAELFGSPLSIDFPLPSHMLLSAEGGAILLYRTRDWALLHTFKGHTGRVNFVATHPSAKLALSGGQDGVLRAWDLTRGKTLGGTKMGMGDGGEMEALHWFGGEGKGHFFALLGRTVVRIFRKDMSEVARIGKGNLTGTRLNDIAVWDLSNLRGSEGIEGLKGKTLIFVAREDKKVGVYLFDRKIFDALDAKAKERAEREGDEEEEEDEDEDEEEQRTLQEIAWLEGHTSRVKAISLQPLALSNSSKPDDAIPWVLTATTISSDGFVRIFNLSVFASSSSSSSVPSVKEGETLCIIKPITEYTTRGSRLTCLSVVGGDGSLPCRSGTGTGTGEQDEDEDDDHDYDYDDEDAEGRPTLNRSLSDVDTDLEGEEDEEGPEDEDAELRRLEEILKEAKREGIDLEELLKNGLGEEVEDGGSDDDDDGSGDDDDDGSGDDDGSDAMDELELEDSDEMEEE